MKEDATTAAVTRLLKSRIEADTIGVEADQLEAEVTYNGRLYWVSYTFRREYGDVHHSYDEEPTGSDRTGLTIHEWGVFDDDGNQVSDAIIDTAALEEYFTTPDCTID